MSDSRTFPKPISQPNGETPVQSHQIGKDILSPSDIVNVPLESEKKTPTKWQKSYNWSIKAFNLLTTIVEALIILITLCIVTFYLIKGVVLHESMYLNRIYGLVKFLNEYWKGALLLFPIFFIKSFLKKLKNLTRASAVGVELETKDENSSLSA